MKHFSLCPRCKMNDYCAEDGGYVVSDADFIFGFYHCPYFINNDGKPLTNREAMRFLTDEECSILVNSTVVTPEWLQEEAKNIPIKS